MKILAISDKINTDFYENFKRSRFQGIELLIACGDLSRYYLNFLIDALNVPCFFVPGNHDAALEKEPPQGWQSLHREMLEHNGRFFAGVGGSPFYNGESPYQYTEFQMKLYFYMLGWRLRKVPKLDVLVTHAPAFGLGDIPGSVVHQGFYSTLAFIERYQPKLVLYGHSHLNYGVKRVFKHNETWLVNAYDHIVIDLENLADLEKYL